MKKNNSLSSRSGLKGLALAVLVASLGITSCKTDFDLDVRTPEWLGTSIFETLDKGFEAVNMDNVSKYYSFQTYIRLIRDMGQEDILSRTGSRTMFVADDAAFERFFENCPFHKADGTPITKYEELSKAQKSMILKGSMLNNVYQVAMLSSTQGPVIGDCMRRLSTFTPYDSITIIKGDEMPDTKYWKRFKTDPKWSNGIAVLKDGTNHPMIFFVNKFLTSRKIYDEDYDFLFNQGRFSSVGKPGRKAGDATVNGVRIEVQNKKCFNGFIHVMADVIYLLPSMAEYLENDNVATIYSHILERFSAPYPSAYQRTEIKNRIKDGKVVLPDGVSSDSIFVKRYLARWRSQSTESDALAGLLANGTTNPVLAPGVTNSLFRLDEASLLLFDPGWNSYYSNTSSNEANVDIQRNVGVMFVPTDKALKAWWMSSAMRERYGWQDGDLTYEQVAKDMDSIPLNVIVKLLNNNMQYSLTSTIPSNFSSVLNDARDPMFENGKEAALSTFDSVVMCCNGAVYYTNTVYAPTSYRSVAYPALVNENLKIINWAINDAELAYSAYLNSMVSNYSVFLPVVSKSVDPTIMGKLIWIDPVSFALNKYGDEVAPEDDHLYAWVFSYNGSRVVADLYSYDYDTKTVLGKVGSVDDTGGDGGIVRNRLMELMDYHIVLGDVEPDAKSSLVPDGSGYTYFRTKGNGEVRFKNAITTIPDPEHPGQNIPQITEMKVAGGYQIERSEEHDITKRYDQYLMDGNGRVYLIDEPLMSSRRSVYDVLSDSVNYPEFKSFFHLMRDLEMFGESHNKHAIGSRFCVSSFNTYHYTLYVPSNKAIAKLFEDGVYYSLSDIDAISRYCGNVRSEALLDPVEGQKIWQDSLIAISKRLRGDATPDNPDTNTKADSLFDYEVWVADRKQDLKNFVNYHLQDNSVYSNAEFNVGRDEFGNTATSAKYETAFMKDDQYAKLTVSGGNDVVVTDANNHTYHIDRRDNSKYCNIMCREYEIDTKDDASKTKVTSIISSYIETSSFAVIHLIDGALCNGDVLF